MSMITFFAYPNRIRQGAHRTSGRHLPVELVESKEELASIDEGLELFLGLGTSR